jgi:hypothetical protein
MKLLLAVCRCALSGQLDLEQIAYWGSDPPIPIAKFRCASGRIQVSLLYAREEHPSAGLRISGKATKQQIAALRAVQLSVVRNINCAMDDLGISDITWKPSDVSTAMTA